jgi:DNA repair exonuclease SbcCD ATPase subunit
MLKRITLVNFMSHERTVLEPAAGLTVLVGPNNCGKSAVVAALRILCNNETADYAIRHGAKETTVTIETDDGHVIEWRRKTANRYTIDGQVFDRLNRQVPEELHKVLRLPTVDFDKKQFDVHFATQKEPLFLLTGSDGDRAQFFASSSDAVLLIEMQKQHAANIREANRKKKEREQESLQLNSVLKTLEPVVELESRLRDAEHLYNELQSVARAEEELSREISQLERADLGRRRFDATTQVLSSLATPPELAPAPALAQTIESLDQATRQLTCDQAKKDALHQLPVPPDQHDCQRLDDLLAGATQAKANVARWGAKAVALDSLIDPPAFSDTAPLQRWLVQYEQAQSRAAADGAQLEGLAKLVEPPKFVDGSQVSALSSLADKIDRALVEHRQWETRLAGAQEDLQELQAELVAFAAAHPKCPTCGAEMDAERLMVEAGQSIVDGHHREHVHE